MPEVSVLIPTYNRAALIGDAIRSILEQTLQDFKLIIYDDGSTDNTWEVVESFNDTRIQYIRNKENKGVQWARNVLLDACDTKYAAWNGSDDLSNIYRLEVQLSYIKRRNLLMVGSNYIGFQDAKGAAIEVVSLDEAYKLYRLPPKEAIPELIKYPYGGDGTNMVEVAMAKTIRYRLNKSLGGGDSIWIRDFCDKYHIRRKLIPKILYYVRYHNQRIGKWRKNRRLNPDWYNRMRVVK